MTKILALDLATRTGFALGARSGVILSGSRLFPKTGDDVGAFGRAFRDWLITGLQRHKPDLIVFELPNLHGSATNINTLRKLYGLAFELEVIAGDKKLGFGIPIKEANSSDWINHFLGRGNVPKGSDARKAAVLRMCGIRGWHADDTDEADALAILDYSIASESAEYALEATPLFGHQAEPQLSAKEVRRRALAKAAGLST